MGTAGGGVDVLVAGGGIMGCCVALFAARGGLRVRLVERGRIGGGTAGASGWSIAQQTKRDPEALELASRSSAHYRDLAVSAGVAYRADGSYVLFRRQEADAVHAHATWLGEHAVDVCMLDRDQVLATQRGVHDDVVGASYAPMDAEVDPVAACRSLAAAAAAAGAEVVERAEVRAVVVGDRGVEGADVDGERVAARNVVLACGPWLPALLATAGVGLDLRLQKGEQLVTAVTGPLLRGRVLSARYLASKHAAGTGAGPRAGLAVGQGPDGAVRIGSTREDSDDPAPTARGRDLLLAETEPYLPAVAALPIARQTVGFRVLAATGRPLVGPVPGADGLHVVTGHGGDGIALAPLSGAVAAARLAGQEPETTALDVPAGVVRW